MRIDFITIFPKMFEPFLTEGVISRGIRQGLLDVRVWDLRDFASDKHRSTDDEAYGGGPGMVMKYEPLRDAVRSLRRRLPPGSREFVLTAQGRPFDQALARELAGAPGLLLVSGRYEGIDERLLEGELGAELSLGDYVLSGGELAAAVVIDAVVRLLPGVLGDESSHVEDSFTAGLLDCPQYTRPEVVDGRQVPEVLLGGDHEAVRRWRLKQALGRTWRKRPELIAERRLTAEEEALLTEFKAQWALNWGDENA